MTDNFWRRMAVSLFWLNLILAVLNMAIEMAMGRYFAGLPGVCGWGMVLLYHYHYTRRW